MRWKIICAYDGTDFTGWQSQTTRDAVQDVIEAALTAILRDPIRIHGAGRTDAGVHAHGQTFHFDHDWNHPGEALLRAANTKLPSTIRLVEARTVTGDFHARFSAKGKHYQYHFSENPPDPFSSRYCWHIPKPICPEAIQSALPYFEGAHDFTAFAGRVVEAENPVKTLERPELIPNGAGNWILSVRGDGFLYRMVRSIAGTLVRVGNKRLAPERIATLLEAGERTPEVYTAPACGLFLNRVFYEDG